MKDPEILAWDSSSGLLSFAVSAMNSGGINASDVVFTDIVTRRVAEADADVQIQTPVPPVAIGGLAIRESGNVLVQAAVPPGVRQFFCGFMGMASGSGRGSAFPENTASFWKTVTVPGRGPVAPSRQPKDLDRWAFALTDPDQPYAEGANLVYHGTIQNLTGADLFLASVDLDFRPNAPAGTYACDLAEEFLATGGIIPVSGYSGPLVVVRWISAPPVGAVGTGSIRLGVNPGLSPLSAGREFRYSSSPQRLRITHFGNGVECSWSTNATGLVLQSTGDALQIEWDAVRAPVRRVGDEFRVYLDIPQRTRFFRLASANAPEGYTLADLSLTMAAPALPQALGIPFAFNLAVTNLGPELASGVVLTSPLPAGLSLVSANASQGQCTSSGETVTCAIGDLDAGQYAVVTLVVSPSAVGLIAASAGVSAWQLDPVESNNVASAAAIVTTPMTINDAALIEGNAGTNLVAFEVRLIAPSMLPVSVQYSTADGTATAGADYLALSGTLVFPPGATVSNILVQVLGDTAVETNETFFVNLSNPSNAILVKAEGMGTIQNDDQPPPDVWIEDTSLVEGTSGTTQAVFAVHLSWPMTLPVFVQYNTANGSATAGSDYTATSGTLTFPAGVTVSNILVPVIGDTVYEPNETFFVNLTNPVNVVLTRAQAVGTIQNDDAAPADAWFTNSALISIPQSGVANPYPSSIAVSGLGPTITKVTVTLYRLNHYYPVDLYILLVGPAGQRVMLMSEAGGENEVRNTTLTFDDAAANQLPRSMPITGGTFRPSPYGSLSMLAPAPPPPYGSALSAFNGANPNGVWELYVYHWADPFGGNIAGGWSLHIQ